LVKNALGKFQQKFIHLRDEKSDPLAISFWSTAGGVLLNYNRMPLAISRD